MHSPPASIQPRKLPRQGRSVAAVEAIYEASARILEEDGLAGLNTNLVAERAGVSVGSLYQYFPSKEAILAGLLRRKRAELLNRVRAVATSYGGLTLELAVSRFLAAATYHQLERPALSRALQYAEAVLPLDQETARLKVEIGLEVAKVLNAFGYSNTLQMAQDIVGLARGMIDAAGLAGETDMVALNKRLSAAVLGYTHNMNASKDG